ncbi:MAG: hypothetical protein ACP5IC_02930, partial [Minisyncoccia bacterium]
MVNNVDKTEDENRKKTKVAENPDLVKKILEPLEFTDIKKNTNNKGKNASKNDIGFDFWAKKDEKDVKIEVKAVTYRNGVLPGIPDSVITEFELDENCENPKFKADYLLVVGLEKVENGSNGIDYRPKEAYLLTRDQINAYPHKIKKIVSFNSKL